MTEKNIVIAFGGRSPEHEVSVLTAMQAVEAFQDTSYHTVPLYISKSGRWLTGEYLLTLEHYQDLGKLQEQAVACTFSFDEMGKPVLLETAKKGLFSKPRSYPIYALIPAFHGSEGENGVFQGACQMFDIPIGGSGVFASTLGMDKVYTKTFCRAHNIPQVPEISFFEEEWQKNQAALINDMESQGYPLMVKPVTLGSSIGITKAGNKTELVEGIETAFRYDEHLLVEKAIEPLVEINCSVLGVPDDNRASVCEQPLGKEETLTFSDKYQNDGTASKGMASAARTIPAEIPDDQKDYIQQLARQIFTLFRACGVARLDFLIHKTTGDIFFNEINTIPGSFSYYLWEEQGMNMKELMLELVDIAIRQHQGKAGRIRNYETNLLNEKAVRGMKGLKGMGNT
jgi:D-alanine-D-alanine ligase